MTPPAVTALHNRHTLGTRARDYMDYCATHLGRFVHHVPDDTTDDTGIAGRDSYLRTRQLVADRFGEPDPTIWPDATALADCQSEGNCTSECTGDCTSS